MRKRPTKSLLFFWLLAAILLGGALGSCSSAGGGASLKMHPASKLPQNVQDSAQTVREAYQFAAANPEIMEQIPCYCGCEPMGHQSNYACYVQDITTDGEIIYDEHALGCSICVDITQDVMRLVREGKPVAEIRSTIDETYSRYGPSNME